MTAKPVFGLLVLGCVGCGGGGGNEVDATNIDAPTAIDAMIDAPVEPGAHQIWYRGDFATNDTDSIGAYDLIENKIVDPMLSNLPDASITSMAVSHDTKTLAVSGETSGGNSVILLYSLADVTNPVQVHSGAAGQSISNLAFSPDDQKLAFIGILDTPQVRSLYVVDATANQTPTRLSNPNSAAGENVTYLAWQPKPSGATMRLVWIGDTGTQDQFGMWSIDVLAAAPSRDTIVATNDTTTTQGVRNLAAFDHLGRVYFKADINTDDLFQLFRANIDGTNREQVPSAIRTRLGGAEASVGTFGFNPTGTELVFSANGLAENSYEFFRVTDLEGTDSTELSIVATAGGPSFTYPVVFSPDGSRFAFSANWGADDFALYTSTYPTWAPVQMATPPTNGDVREIAFTHDSKRIITRGDLVTDNDLELFVFDTFDANQDATGARVQSVVSGGDVAQFVSF